MTPQGYSFYVSGNNWSSLSNPWSGTATGQPPGLATGDYVLLSVPLCPKGVGLSAVSANVGTFTTLAKALIGIPTIIRLGWEFDGILPSGQGWMDWGPVIHGNTPALYASASAVAIKAMKAANPALKFDLSCNIGSSSLAQLQAYLGNNASLYDFFGGDHYDNVGGGGNAVQYGPVVQLCAVNNKPLSAAEWGLNGTDNPAFINTMSQLLTNPAGYAKAENWPVYTVGYHSYFSAALSINSDITQFPNSMAAFKTDFGP